MSDCVFCDRIAVGEYDEEWLSVVRFAPLNPVAPGHMLFVPRRHVSSAAADPLRAAHAFQFAADYAHRLDAYSEPPAEAFNLITSAGRAATQTIRHLHVHYVPRRAGDGLHLPWTNQAVGSVQEQASTEEPKLMPEAAEWVRAKHAGAAISAHARGDFAAERRALDALALLERAGASTE